MFFVRPRIGVDKSSLHVMDVSAVPLLSAPAADAAQFDLTAT